MEALKHRLLPVIALPELDHAEPLAEALLAAGLPVMEITLRTPAGLPGIQRIRERYPDMILGAGTVTDPASVPALKDAGAQFLVSPGLNPKTVEAAQEHGLPIFPGVATPTEIEQALSLGVKSLKFFPAEPLGGVRLLKAFLAPYGHLGLSFVPTGGVTPTNLRDYLALAGVAAAGGSWFVKPDLLKAGQWDEVQRLTREALALAAEA